MVKAYFKWKAPEANANFNVFKSQRLKIMVLSKALKAKLSKYLSGVASLSTPHGCSTTHRGDAHAPFISQS